MEIQIDGIKIFYKRQDGTGTPILLLHGWGASCETMQGLYNFFTISGRTVISIDFPYFGQSEPPPQHYGIYDYAALVKSFLSMQDIHEVIILGHSFGGRVGIILAAKECSLVKKLILIDAAGCKPRKKLKHRLKVLIYKIKKKLKLKTGNSGSSDYKNLPSFMRGIFVRVVNTHLESQMKKITVPTLLIWGKNDADTPLYMAQRMNKLIKDSGLVVLDNAGHFSFVDRLNDVCVILNSFVLESA